MVSSLLLNCTESYCVVLVCMQASRQEKIIEAVLVFLDSVLINQSDIITMETLTYFADSLNKHLRDNSRDAVKDYLIW